MILGGQLQSFTNAGQASSISKVPKSSIRQRIGIWACQETWRHKTTCPQCSKYAKVHPLVHKIVWNKQTKIAVVLFYAGIYCGIFEIVFVVVQKKWRQFDSRSHPPTHTYTQHHHLEEDVEKTEFCLSWNSCETFGSWGEICQNPHPSFLPIFQQRIGSQVIIVGDLGLASDNFVKHKEVI